MLEKYMMNTGAVIATPNTLSYGLMERCVMSKQDQIGNMRNIAGNLAVYARQLHDAAYQQFDLEAESGSHSPSRDRLICEIGTQCVNIEYAIRQIVGNLDMLNEIPRDFNVADDFEIWIMR